VIRLIRFERAAELMEQVEELRVDWLLQAGPEVPQEMVQLSERFRLIDAIATIRNLEALTGVGVEERQDALAQLNHLLRDFRTSLEKPIDPKLFDLLHELGGTLETDQPYHIISGYRSPETNAMLRERGGAHTGVASGSLHMVGKAIDIRLPGVKLDHLRSAAASLKLGGVGFYPSSNFVHIDTGRVRYW
jgi:uncharacterized protein YcbK (DUF882 family)